MAQTERQRPARNPLADARVRAVALLLLVIGLLLAVLWMLGGLDALDIFFSVWLGVLVIYTLIRMGFFAARVWIWMPGESRPVIEKLRKTQGGRRFTATQDATYLTADEAIGHIGPEDRVIGIEVNGDAVAYPLSAMGLREAANDEVGGVKVAVTWWPVTYSARAYVRTAPEAPDSTVTKEFVFSPTPYTVLNSAVLNDQDGDGFVQFLGQAVTGQRAGLSLEELPVVSTNWRAWSNAHPETEVMSKQGTPEFDVFEGYYRTPRPGLHQQPAKDRRWRDKDTVFGLEVNGEAKAYPYPALIEEPIMQEELGGEPVLVVLERISATAVAYLRKIDGGASTGSARRTLTFQSDSKNRRRPEDENVNPDRIKYEPLYLKDTETGSRWMAITGECVEGPLKGQRLKMLPGKTAFWFAWSRFYRQAAVVDPPPDAPPNPPPDVAP